LHPTLGSPTRSLDEIYDRLGDLSFVAEFKYDGQRAQIHGIRGAKDDNPVVHVFSRHLEDMTTKVSCALHRRGRSLTLSPKTSIPTLFTL
jgi:DNA ligase-1